MSAPLLIHPDSPRTGVRGFPIWNFLGRRVRLSRETLNQELQVCMMRIINDRGLCRKVNVVTNTCSRA
jgi:hypothetical protein